MYPFETEGHVPQSESDRITASKRRQAYHRRRGEIQRVAKKERLLSLDRMPTGLLYPMLRRELLDLVGELEALSSPRLYEAARRGLELAEELEMRGDQITLFPA